MERSPHPHPIVERAVAMVRLSRPPVLLAGILAYLAGTALAYREGTTDVPLLLAGLMIFLVGNASGHYADEYGDRDTDAMTRRTMFTGGSGVLPSGIVPEGWALVAMSVTGAFALALCALSWILGATGPMPVLIMAMGLVAGYAYSLLPLQLERRGLGEIDNALVGGYLMPLFGFTFMGGDVDPETIAFLTPLVLAVFVNLLGGHWADREADAMVGKRTLVVRSGERARLLHMASVLLLIAVIVILSLTEYPRGLSVAMIAVSPLAMLASYDYGSERTPYLSTLYMGLTFIVWTVALYL